MSLLKLKKKEIEDLALQTAEAVCDSANKDMMELYSESKKKEYFEKCFQKNLESYVIDERSKYPEKRLEMYGASFELSSTGDRLDYSRDQEYNDLQRKLKAREAELKRATLSSGTYFDSDGVQVEKVPIKTHSKQVIKVSF